MSLLNQNQTYETPSAAVPKTEAMETEKLYMNEGMNQAGAGLGVTDNQQFVDSQSQQQQVPQPPADPAQPNPQGEDAIDTMF